MADAASEYRSVVIDRKQDGKIVAGPYIRFQDAETARRRLRKRQPHGDFWIATEKEVESGVITY